MKKSNKAAKYLNRSKDATAESEGTNDLSSHHNLELQTFNDAFRNRLDRIAEF